MRRALRGVGLVWLLAMGLADWALGEVRITEVMASNTRAWPEITDFEDYPDWFEIYNSSATETVDLSRYLVSDDLENPEKWSFGAGARLAPGEFRVVVASGNDAKLGETFTRDYWPFAKFTTEKDHTNFGLSSGGETLVLSKREGEPFRIVVAEEAAHWQYWDFGFRPSIGWTTGGDSQTQLWKVGTGPFGWGEEVGTVISFGENPQDKHLSSYYRIPFDSAELTTEDLELLVIADDSAAVYLNGVEIGRQDLAPGPLDFNTRSIDPLRPNEEFMPTTYQIPAASLVEGTNWLALEVHQTGPTSIDSYMSAVLRQSRDSPVVEVDRVTFPAMVSDVSYTRKADGSGDWYVSGRSTPGREVEEVDPVVNVRVEAGKVSFSASGGVYGSGVDLVLTAGEGEIRYTTDGTEPSFDSPLYETPIKVAMDGATVLRARAFVAGQVPGPIRTETYFPQLVVADHQVPVIALTAPPQSLFDDRIGIYFNQHEPNRGVGPAVYKGKDAPANFEFFGGEEHFNVNGALRMGGENNWSTHFQRAFNFVTRGKYGDDDLGFQVFPESKANSYTALTIREGGDDWGVTHLTDSIWAKIAGDRLEVETNRSRPTVVYINGTYWGYYNLRDRWDETWFFQNYGVNGGEYDHVRFENVNETAGAENGSTKSYQDLLRLLDSGDLADDEFFARAARSIDLDSLIDFLAAEGFGRNSSWKGNREQWRPAASGGKWRWMIPDMDRTFARSKDDPILEELMDREPIFKRLRANRKFKAYTYQRILTHAWSTFLPARTKPILAEAVGFVRGELAAQQLRWGEPTTEDFEQGRQRIENFLDRAPVALTQEIRELSGAVGLGSIDLTWQRGGHYLVAGVVVKDGLFPTLADEPVTVRAVPNAGMQFVRWEDGAEVIERVVQVAAGETLPLGAIFAPNEVQVFRGVDSNDVVLEAGTYAVFTDVTVPPNGKLTLRPGVTLLLAAGVDLRVYGQLLAEGTVAEPIVFKAAGSIPWGGVSLEEPTAASSFKFVTVTGASHGHDAVRYPAAIAGLNATVELDHVKISEGRQPLFFRGGAVRLLNSQIESPLTGDGINVKQGSAYTENCTFLGNLAPDTDAIDFDGVVNGVVRGCRIYRFFGFNSDGVDFGEGSLNCLLEDNRFFYLSDKGVSVGQGSTVVMRNNVLVGCGQGVGIKDEGSEVVVDQNTFVDCDEGVAVFEKNLGAGGSVARVTHSTFSKVKVPVSADARSSVVVDFSLSDTLALPGSSNLLGAPDFENATRLNFNLKASSPGRDSGDPGHALDTDGTRADRAASYQFSAGDYPFLLDEAIVINEVLSNSGNGGDLVEFYNSSQDAVNVGGWFFSDDENDLQKYQIAEGTIVPAAGYLVLSEEENFGARADDAGSLLPFGIQAAGETLYLSSGVRRVTTDYRHERKVRAAEAGVSVGLVPNGGEGGFDFAPLVQSTFGRQNAAVKSGPVVICEVAHRPAEGQAEFIELANVSGSAVDLSNWEFTDGVGFKFPEGTRLVAGGHLVVAGAGELDVPEGVPVLRWSDGRLNNGGERIELSKPALQGDFIVPVERVRYQSGEGWPVPATGQSYQKRQRYLYGNDGFSWMVGSPTPGECSDEGGLASWLTSLGIGAGDEDGDGISNRMEYALGSDPFRAGDGPQIRYDRVGGKPVLSYQMVPGRGDVGVKLLRSVDLNNWFDARTIVRPGLPGEPVEVELDEVGGERVFYRFEE